MTTISSKLGHVSKGPKKWWTLRRDGPAWDNSVDLPVAAYLLYLDKDLRRISAACPLDDHRGYPIRDRSRGNGVGRQPASCLVQAERILGIRCEREHLKLA